MDQVILHIMNLINLCKNALERILEMPPTESETIVASSHGQTQCISSCIVLFVILLFGMQPHYDIRTFNLLLL
jgi:hypothetical protein